MKTEHQLIGALALLAALGGVYFVTQSSEKAEREQRTNVKAAYPQVSLAKDAADKLTKLELKNGDKPAVVLENGIRTHRLSPLLPQYPCSSGHDQRLPLH